MAKAIIMPKMGNTVTTVVVGEIFINEGDKIEVGQKLFDYETDKTSVDFISEDAGTVLKIMMAEGDEVEVLKNIIIVGEEGDDISEFTS